MTPFRILILAAVLVFSGTRLGCANDIVPNSSVSYNFGEVQPKDFVIGSPKAAVTIIEYASLTCLHCSEFETDVFPKLKKAYIDTGKVRFVLRDYPLDSLALKAAILARCQPRENYFSFIELLFKQQSKWAFAKDGEDKLRFYSKFVGMTDDAISQCLDNPENRDAALRSRIEASQVFKVNSTPSFIINGTKRELKTLSFQEFEEILKPLISQ